MNVFDRMAGSFDTARRVRRAERIAGRMAARLGPGKRVLDFGCGTGLIGLGLLEFAESVLFMDPSSAMIEELRAKLVRVPCGNKARTLAGEFPPEHARFDCVVSSMALHHVQDTSGIFRRFFKVLEEDGLVLAVDLDPVPEAFHADEPDFAGHHGFEREALVRICAAAGFRRTATETVFSGHRPMRGGSVPYTLFLLEARK